VEDLLLDLVVGTSFALDSCAVVVVVASVVDLVVVVVAVSQGEETEVFVVELNGTFAFDLVVVAVVDGIIVVGPLVLMFEEEFVLVLFEIVPYFAFDS
jgi:hypothetical protein